MDLGRIPEAAARNRHGRYSLRHEVVQTRYRLDGRFGRHIAGKHQPCSAARHSLSPSLFATAVTRRICRSPTSAAKRPGSLTNTTEFHSHQSTVVQHACSCRTSIFGKARNGCVASKWSKKTGRDSGNRLAITIAAIPGKSSDTQVIKFP